jgi:hypothetical protein
LRRRAFGNFGRAVIHNRVADRFLHSRGTTATLCRRDERRGHRDNFAAHNRARVTVLESPATFQTQPRDRLPAAMAQVLIIWTLVYDHRIVVGDIGDVDRLADDRDVPLLWNNGLLDAQ